MMERGRYYADSIPIPSIPANMIITAFIDAIKFILLLLIGVVTIYCLLTFEDPVRGGVGMWFLLAVMILAWYVLNRIQLKLKQKK